MRPERAEGDVNVGRDLANALRALERDAALVCTSLVPDLSGPRDTASAQRFGRAPWDPWPPIHDLMGEGLELIIGGRSNAVVGQR